MSSTRLSGQSGGYHQVRPNSPLWTVAGLLLPITILRHMHIQVRNPEYLSTVSYAQSNMLPLLHLTPSSTLRIASPLPRPTLQCSLSRSRAPAHSCHLGMILKSVFGHR
jgi:hypothetical protein